MQTHVHDESGEAIEGLQLVPGAIIRHGDLYASSDGWEASIWRNIPLLEPRVKWVRPHGLSQLAREVLRYLTRRTGYPKFIHMYDNKFAVTCHDNWQHIDWNRTGSPSALNPYTLQELIDCGYISRLRKFGQIFEVTYDGECAAAELNE